MHERSQPPAASVWCVPYVHWHVSGKLYVSLKVCCSLCLGVLLFHPLSVDSHTDWAPVIPGMISHLGENMCLRFSLGVLCL